jgi:DNA-directed RNA polymerase subunit beta'
MSDAQNLPERINDLAAVSIRLASPEDIYGWSQGEVTHPDFLKEPLDEPNPQGLFSERIFGPIRDWCCGCRFQGRPRWWGPEHRGERCPKCNVTIDQSLVRRRHMGHINLAVPIVHTWFLRSRPSPLALLLDIRARDLEQIASYRVHVVLSRGKCRLKPGQLLDDMEYLELRGQGKEFEADTGGRAIRALLERIKLPQQARKVRKELEALRAKRVRSPRQKQLSRALEVITWLQKSGNKPEWMLLDYLPVIPPDLRPMRDLPGSKVRFSSDLNLFYENILRVNQRLRELIRRGAPSAVLRDQSQHLQRCVDELFDNAHCETPRQGASRRPLKSLTDLLQGKAGRFRQNLLGKRVDYSGRGVIVCGPNLRLNQCGLPRAIAEELFQPYLLGRLARLLYWSLGMEWNASLRAAYMKLKGRDAKAREALRGALPKHRLADASKTLDSFTHLRHRWLEEALASHLVLLNRAPSLHRMSIQAFEPVLCDGKTILLHPLVCEGFGADFDGDTMAVHLPLSTLAQDEARRLMLPVQNL